MVASCGCKFAVEIEGEKRPSRASKPLTLAISDTIANIAKIEPALADVPCTNILGLVIYDLPGRDCAAKASNGELKVGEISRYKTEYIDREKPPRCPESKKAHQY